MYNWLYENSACWIALFLFFKREAKAILFLQLFSYFYLSDSTCMNNSEMTWPLCWKSSQILHLEQLSRAEQRSVFCCIYMFSVDSRELWNQSKQGRFRSAARSVTVLAAPSQDRCSGPLGRVLLFRLARLWILSWRLLNHTQIIPICFPSSFYISIHSSAITKLKQL
jgi:hypothetical protein